MSKYNNGNHKNSSNQPKLYHFFSVPNLVLLPRFNILSFPFCSWFKVIADNTFAIPLLTNTVRIIDWTIEEIKDRCKNQEAINDDWKLPSKRRCRYTLFTKVRRGIEDLKWQPECLKIELQQLLSMLRSIATVVKLHNKIPL